MQVPDDHRRIFSSTLDTLERLHAAVHDIHRQCQASRRLTSESLELLRHLREKNVSHEPRQQEGITSLHHPPPSAQTTT
jgi:hypothetical protein